MSCLKSKKINIVSLSVLSVLFSAFLLFCSPCQASETYTVSEEQLKTLEQNLNVLEQNNEKLLILLNESDEASTEALKQLKQSKQELVTLRQELSTAKIETENAKKSLKTANEELANASQSLKQSEKVKDRIENQRTIWQIISGILLVVAAR